MSTLSIATIQSLSSTTDLTLKTGNTSGPSFIIPANGSALIFQSNSSTNVMSISTSGSQILSGFTVNAYNIGVVTSNVTINAAAGNYQYMTANAAFTITGPSSDSAVDVLILNGSGAGSITMNAASFTANTQNSGDTYVTTSTYQFLLSIRRINGIATYVWKALQ